MDREWLAQRLASGDSYEVIGRALDRHPSTVSSWARRAGLVSVHVPVHCSAWRPRTRRAGFARRRGVEYSRDCCPRRQGSDDRPTLAARLRARHPSPAAVDAGGSVRGGRCLCRARADDLRTLRRNRPPSVSALPPPTRIRPPATRQEHPARRGRGLLSGLWIRQSPVSTAFSPRRSDREIDWTSPAGRHAVARSLPSRGTKVCPPVRELPRGGRVRSRSATLPRRATTPCVSWGERGR